LNRGIFGKRHERLRSSIPDLLCKILDCWPDGFVREVRLFPVCIREDRLEALLNYCRVIDVPFPTHRLASSALRALRVDEELSSIVHRQFSLISPSTESSKPTEQPESGLNDEANTILRTAYSATTNRMLRVAVNGFMESLSVVLQVMEELDVDVLEAKKAGG
jgi:EKC/KEOPS complex subunit PCC1/LAGE3